MIDALQRLDERILALFTKFSHWFQRLIGLTNYFWARFFLGLCFSDCVIGCLNYWRPILGQAGSLLEVGVCLAGCGFAVLYLPIIHRAEEDSRTVRNVKSIAQLELKQRFNSGLRLATLYLVAIPLGPAIFINVIWQKKGFWALNLHYNLFASYLLCFFYFAVVDPLGPGQSKVRQWVDSFQAGFRKLQPASSSN